eukprot:1147547-Pelagomonas_calceolata.AAC.1
MLIQCCLIHYEVRSGLTASLNNYTGKDIRGTKLLLESHVQHLRGPESGAICLGALPGINPSHHTPTFISKQLPCILLVRQKYICINNSALDITQSIKNW